MLLAKRGLPLSRAVVNILRNLIKVEDISVSHVILIHHCLSLTVVLYLNHNMKLNSEKIKTTVLRTLQLGIQNGAFLIKEYVCSVFTLTVMKLYRT